MRSMQSGGVPQGHALGQHVKVFSQPACPRGPCQVEEAPPGVALDLHVRGWRRFLELPVDHILAHLPDTARGRFRVGVFLSPQVTGPRAARLVALHAQYHVGILGFHEEQVR